MVAGGTYVLGVILTVLAGVLLSIQSGTNATLGKNVGRSFAAVASFSVGLATLAIYFAVDYGGLKNKGPTLETLRAAPWWSWLGGLYGATYVAIVIIFAQTLGAGTLTAISVTSQLIASIVLDAVGWFGFAKKPLQWPRVVGVVLLLCGVALITIFDGMRELSTNITGDNRRRMLQQQQQQQLQTDDELGVKLNSVHGDLNGAG